MRYVVATKIARFVCLVLAASILAGCGGGGGASAPPNGGSANAEARLTLANTSLTFKSRAPGAEPPEAYITASIAGATQISGTLYVLIAVEGPAVRDVANININPQTLSGSAAVYPQVSRTLGVGTHTSTIRITACVNSPTCSSGQLRDSPQVVNVTYSIEAFQPRHKLLASDTGIAFTSLPSLSSLTRTLQV